MRRRQKKPPYVGKLLIDMPDGSQKTVKLPSVTDYEFGARESVSFKWKERHQVTVKLVRIEGGWDVVEG